jgi:hypothetical protein
MKPKYEVIQLRNEINRSDVIVSEHRSLKTALKGLKSFRSWAAQDGVRFDEVRLRKVQLLDV